MNIFDTYNVDYFNNKGGCRVRKVFILASAACSFAMATPAAAAITATTPDFVNAGPPGYIPLPGSPIKISACKDGEVPKSLSAAFPDITSRFALASLDKDGSASFGPVAGSAKNKIYRAYSDFAYTDMLPFHAWIKETRVTKEQTLYDVKSEVTDGYQEVVIPVLIGAGFRVTAEFVTTEGKIDISGLSAIGAKASASKLVGTLMMESIGISGKSIGTSFPITSKLDQGTVEAAIAAIGTARAFIYAQDRDEITMAPRVVGMISPGTNPALVTAIYAELIKSSAKTTRTSEESEKLTWTNHCRPASTGK